MCVCVCKYLHLYLYTCLIWYLHVCGCALHVWPFGIVMINRWNWKCRVFGFSHHFQTNPFWPFLMLRGKGLLARVPDVVINFFAMENPPFIEDFLIKALLKPPFLGGVSLPRLSTRKYKRKFFDLALKHCSIGVSSSRRHNGGPTCRATWMLVRSETP